MGYLHYFLSYDCGNAAGFTNSPSIFSSFWGHIIQLFMLL